MRRAILLHTVLVLTLAFASGESEAAEGDGKAESKDIVAKTPWGEALQLLLVTTTDWSTPKGALRRYERPGPNLPWTPVGEEVAVVVGRKGLGWGRGWHEVPAGDAPHKKEGDGKAPAGVFSLTQVFGYLPEAKVGAVDLPYLHTVPGIECVDDVGSSHYNDIVDRRKIERPDWSSSEKMRRKDALYRLGVVVAHNGSTPKPGAGSCIFLHIWRSAAKGTAGCTAMSPDHMEALVHWLKADAAPVLIQLPRAARAALAAEWGLPD